MIAKLKHAIFGCTWVHHLEWNDPTDQDRGGILRVKCSHCGSLLHAEYLEGVGKWA
jgi:hypothetical protein